jgi:hypothetical protein
MYFSVIIILILLLRRLSVSLFHKRVNKSRYIKYRSIQLIVEYLSLIEPPIMSKSTSWNGFCLEPYQTTDSTSLSRWKSCSPAMTEPKWAVSYTKRQFITHCRALGWISLKLLVKGQDQRHPAQHTNSFGPVVYEYHPSSSICDPRSCNTRSFKSNKSCSTFSTYLLLP